MLFYLCNSDGYSHCTTAKLSEWLVVIAETNRPQALYKNPADLVKVCEF